MLVEEHEEEGDFDALGGEPVGVACTIALDQSVGFHFAQIVAELVQAVALGGQTKVDQEGLMELFGAPTTDHGAPVQQNFHQPDHPGVVDLDAGILRGSDGDRQGQPL